jgi:4'-phosphopantetheinyl transferase
MRLAFHHIDDQATALAADEIHLWSAPLDRGCDPAFLTLQERSRAEKLKLDRVRNQFIASRVQLRIILGRYLGIDPASVPIAYEHNGKPILHASFGSDLHFNVSHSESVAVYAVTVSGRVGVDVEFPRHIPDAQSLVERFFSPRDREVFNGLSDSERLPAFFRAWTRKEAVLKAVGLGVPSLDRCEVTFGPSEPEMVLRLGDDVSCSAKWVLRSWSPIGEYVAAVAVELTRTAG